MFSFRVGILRREVRGPCLGRDREKKMRGGRVTEKKFGSKFWSSDANRDRYQSHVRP